MRIAVLALFFLLGLALRVQGEPIGAREENDESLMDCVFEDNTVSCLTTRIARNIDGIEMQVTGKKSDIPMSTVMEQTGNFVAEVIDDIQNPEEADEAEDSKEAGQQEEGRRKKFGKKKKKHLQKLLGLAMLFKAKLSLLLQIISTHFQLKFFGIAILSLIINAAKFWLDLKKSPPAKVIYYEHAQHQHHYDHDDHEQSYWGRSSSEKGQDLAYAAYAPKN